MDKKTAETKNNGSIDLADMKTLARKVAGESKNVNSLRTRLRAGAELL